MDNLKPCSLSTKEIIELCGDRWAELFRPGRSVYVIINDAIDWSKKKPKLYMATDEAKIREMYSEDDKVYLILSGQRFKTLERRLDDNSFMDTVFLFYDEAEDALRERGLKNG